MSDHFQADFFQAERIQRPEASFDSGYSTSPSKFLSVLSPDSATPGISKTVPTMDHRTYIRSPYKGGGLQSGLGDDFSIINALTSEPVSLSPFKESSLSPFKLISQSPSKGAFEDWDKDFLAGFEEKLFGMGDLNDIAVEELLKSPQGKAYLSRKNSPLRMGNNTAVRRLKISPDSKRPGQMFQPLHVAALSTQNENIGQGVNGMFESVVVKDEPLDNDGYYEIETVVDMSPVDIYQGQTNPDMYGQSSIYVNALSAVDPNKMGATPVKPRYTNVGAPKRKLAMKAPVHSIAYPSLQPVQIQRECRIRQSEQTWPSKEKLKFARTKFQEVLNKAVEKELEMRRKEKAKKGSLVNKQEKINQPRSGKGKGGGKGGKSASARGKGKTAKRTSKKEKYSEIRSALSSKTLSGRSRGNVQQKMHSAGGKKKRNDDPGWYPDDEEDDDEVEENWAAPPFHRQVSMGFLTHEDMSEEEYIDVGQDSLYHYEALVGNPSLKRRRVY